MSVALVGMHGALCSCPGGRAVRFQELLSCAMPSGLDCGRWFKTLCVCAASVLRPYMKGMKFIPVVKNRQNINNFSLYN